jgi:hypothetical protein
MFIMKSTSNRDDRNGSPTSGSSRTALLQPNEKVEGGTSTFLENKRSNDSGPAKTADKIRNPLGGLSKEELMADFEVFTQQKGFIDSLSDLQKGALIFRFEMLIELNEEEKECLRREKTHKWNQPFIMYFMTSESCPSILFECWGTNTTLQFFALGLPSSKEWTKLLLMVHNYTTSTSST